MRKPMVRAALGWLIGAALALAPVALEAQAAGRATGAVRSGGTSMADRSGSGSGISGVVTWPFGTIQRCDGVSVVTASSIWGTWIRDCGRRIATRHSVTGIFPIALPVYVAAPYVYSDTTLPTGGMPAFITPAPRAPAAQPAAARTVVFDTSRPYTLVSPSPSNGVPLTVYTAGGAVIHYVEHPPEPKAEPVALSRAEPAPSACARLTVILASGDGWWKTIWLPALGASTVESLRAAVDERGADEPLAITDATGALVDLPEGSAVRTIMIDRCPPTGDGG